MLEVPKLAKCSNRKEMPRENLIYGGPEIWMTNDSLSKVGLFGISFDFFVDWTKMALSKEIWIKGIVRDDYKPWPEMDKERLMKGIVDCYGREYVGRVSSFAENLGLELRYVLFRDSDDWRSTDSVLAAVRIRGLSDPDVEYLSLVEVMSEIRRLSGGPVTVGSKGLIFGTSRLECFLSKTNAAWPGDVDRLILNDADVPTAILEFKKHNLSTPIEDQTLSNYYPERDSRKYDRLAILRDSLKPRIPIIVIYYSTVSGIESAKLECIDGPVRELSRTKSVLFPLQDNISNNKELFISTIRGMIEN